MVPRVKVVNSCTDLRTRLTLILLTWRIWRASNNANSRKEAAGNFWCMPYSVDLVISQVLIGCLYVMSVVPTFASLRYCLENFSRLPALITPS